MYPVILRIGTFEITSFGVMVALGALVGLWMLRRELQRSGLPGDAVDSAVWGLFGGLLGAKLLWTLENMDGGEPFTSLFFSRGGMSWFGGFVGGVGAALWVMRRRGWPVIAVVSAATPALALRPAQETHLASNDRPRDQDRAFRATQEGRAMPLPQIERRVLPQMGGADYLGPELRGRNLRMNTGLFWQALHLGPAQREEIEHRRAVERIIDFLEIQHIRKAPVGQLPYGLQKRVELGRALAAAVPEPVS